MKRSEINCLIKKAEKFFNRMNFILPPFAGWTYPADWKKNTGKSREIFDCSLGWDLTDFGSGDFNKTGLLLFTVRNGIKDSKTYRKTYAEKIMIVEPFQVTPMHFHWQKMEDIINRGGGDLVIQLFNSAKEEALDKNRDVIVSCDGIKRRIKAGGRLTLEPGESITLMQGVYHKFWAEKSRVMVGEVSMVNDDSSDNRFLEKCGRFPEITEDEKPYRLIVGDYKTLL